MVYSLITLTKLIVEAPASALTRPKDLGEVLFSSTGFIQNIVNIFVKLPFIIFPIMIIAGGFMYMMSAGNEQNMKKAQATITWGIVGFVITMIAFGLVIMVKKLIAPSANVNPTNLPRPVF